MYCGKVEIDVKLLPQWGPPRVSGLRSLRNWYLSHTDTTMCHPGKKQPLPGLLSLVVITFGYESTDLRDSIFSLLGLAKKASNTVQSLERSFTVDYNRPVIPVVTETAKELMEARIVLNPQLWDHRMVIEPLHALCLTQIQPATRIDGMPSWVPNFHEGLLSKRLTQPEFCASGKRTKCNIWPSEMRVLNVDAYMLDTITRTEEKATIDEPGSTMTAIWPADRNTGELAESGVIQVETLWSTLIADDDAFQQSVERATEPVPRQSSKDFLCGHLKKGRENDERYNPIWKQLDTTRNASNADLIPTSKEVDDFELPEFWDNKDWYQVKKSRFEQYLSVYYVQRILFRTSLGYLGLGLNTVQPGDQVWLLAGARTPFVLRPAENPSGEEQFHFVAECYVHGVMYGEAVDGRNDVAFRSIVIV